HIMYDVVWMALPIFMSSAPTALLHKLIVVTLSMLPIWILLYARIRNGHWIELPVTTHNEYWRPHMTPHRTPEQSITMQSITISPWTCYGIFATSFLALIGWITFTRFTADTPSMHIDRMHAHTIATRYFTEHAIPLNGAWKLLTH